MITLSDTPEQRRMREGRRAADERQRERGSEQQINGFNLDVETFGGENDR